MSISNQFYTVSPIEDFVSLRVILIVKVESVFEDCEKYSELKSTVLQFTSQSFDDAHYILLKNQLVSDSYV